MSKQIVLSSSSRVALFIVEKALSVALDREIMLKDVTIVLHDPWAHKFEDGAQIREAILTGHLRLKEGEKEEEVTAAVSVFSYTDGRSAIVPPNNRQTIQVAGMLLYAIWQESGEIKVGDGKISPIPWTYTEGYVKDYMDR